MAIVNFLQIDHEMLKYAVGNTIHGQEVNFTVTAEAAWATTADGVRTLPAGLSTPPPNSVTLVNNTHIRKFSGMLTLYFDWTEEEIKEEPEEPDVEEEEEPAVDDPFSDDWTIELDFSPIYDINVNIYPSWEPEPIIPEIPEIVYPKT